MSETKGLLLKAVGLAAAVGVTLFVIQRSRRKPVIESSPDNLNDNLSVRVLMRTSQMQWQRSGPSATVERKRCFRAGGQESGAVTSVVRYLPNASFPAHPHPQGEEIFVLDGVFSDARGDHTAGTFLLNPEGFTHAPSSGPGNKILVRLRQYPNSSTRERPQRALQTNDLAWEQHESKPGIAQKILFDEPGFLDKQWLEKWEKGATIKPTTVGDGGLELFVVEGGFADAQGNYSSGDWLRLPVAAEFAPRLTDSGCVLLCKSGGFHYAIPE